MQPIFEAFTNSMESIRLRQSNSEVHFDSTIKITLHYRIDLFDNASDIEYITIQDNGIGFDDANYGRIIRFKDDTKGFNNRGSGRIQLIHYFDEACFESVYKQNNEIFRRKFTLSATPEFISRNTIIYNDLEPTPTETLDLVTSVRLSSLRSEKDIRYYSEITLETIKEELIKHYILSFCNLKPNIPRIIISKHIGGQEAESIEILIEEIPSPYGQHVLIEVPQNRISNDMKRLEQLSENKVEVCITPYKISEDTLSENAIKLTSKGEVLDTPKVKLTCLDPASSIGGCRFLFLLSSPYFDELEGDERGNIEILDKTEFKKRAKAQGHINEQIVIDDIQDMTNDEAVRIFVEIAEKKEELMQNIERLKEKYLLSEDALEDMGIGSSIEDVFEKAYEYDAKLLAKETARYEENIVALHKIDPTSKAYEEELSKLVNDLVESIPIQNRTTLTRYVARRKMVIELMSEILSRNTDVQENSERNNDEKLLHNLIFKQKSENPLESDLWILNEEYMYYKGSSESRLSKVKYDDVLIFRDEFEEEEQRYLNSLGQDRLNMRTDVLLFPAEGKCLIIEFKNPNVNVSQHLNQINMYASFLRNYTKDEFEFLKFYGYLIGEGVENRDVVHSDGDFIDSPSMDYLFRSHKRIVDTSGREKHGSLYTEIIKYSSLIERASVRNKAFIDKIFSTETNQ